MVKNKRSNKKISLLKKRQLEGLFARIPWSPLALRALCAKYKAKLQKKPENKGKILQTIINHLNHRNTYTDTDWDLILKFISINFTNPDEFKTLIGPE